MQITALRRPDYAGKAANQVRALTFKWLLEQALPPGRTMLDLGCGPLLYAQHGRRAGYHVTAVDGREVRVPELDDEGIDFVLSDVRAYDIDPARFDVICVLGLLYHLTIPDQRSLLERCRGTTVIVDTNVYTPGLATSALWARGVDEAVEDDYDGIVFREVENPQASIGNRTSFWHTEESILRLFNACGYESVSVVDPAYQGKYGPRRFYVLL